MGAGFRPPPKGTCVSREADEKQTRSAANNDGMHSVPEMLPFKVPPHSRIIRYTSLMVYQDRMEAVRQLGVITQVSRCDPSANVFREGSNRIAVTGVDVLHS